MSYSVEIDTTEREGECRVSRGMYVTTFAGGRERGRMVQIGLGGEFVQLDTAQLERLKIILDFASKRSLVDWPGAA